VSHLELQEFGVPVLLRGDVVIQVGGKPLALLLWLAHSKPRRTSRQEVCAIFWPDDPVPNGRRSLRQALVLIRRWVGPEAVCTDEDWVWLADGAVALESDRFRELLRASSWVDAMALYRGAWALGVEQVAGIGLERWVHVLRKGFLADFETAVQRRSDDAVTMGDVRRAVEVAKAAVTAVPDHEPFVCRLVEALVLNGDVSSARALLVEYGARVADGETPSDAVQLLKRRLDRGGGALADDERVMRPGEQLIARDESLSAALRALAHARQGRPQRLYVSGPMGVGKSRLLDELEARVRTWPVRTVRIALTPEMRTAPGTMLAAIARMLGRMGGAAGLSTSSAGVVIALAPDLQRQFPAVPPAATPLSSHATIAALRDLVLAVSEERTLVLLLDDAHNADSWSWRIWTALDPGASASWLEVTTSRTAEAPASWIPVPVAALTPTDIRVMLEGIALLPDAAWATGVVDTVYRFTGGMPGAILRVMQELDLRGALQVWNREWRASDPANLGNTLQEAMRQARHPADPLAAHLVSVLRLWGMPMGEHELLRITQQRWPDVALPAWRAALLEAERDGILAFRAGEWGAIEPFVGSFAEPANYERDALLHAMRRHFCRRGSPALPELEHFVRLVGGAGVFPVLSEFVRPLLRNGMLRPLGLEGRPLARYLTTVAGRPEWEDSLYEAMGPIGRRSRRALLALGAVATTLVLCLATLLALWQPRLQVEARPIAMTGVDGVVGLVVQPRVALYDGFGRRRPELAVPVRVKGVRTRVLGDTVRRVDEGRVQFERLALAPVPRERAGDDARPPLLVFEGPWWVRSTTVDVSGVWWDHVHDRLRVVRAAVNGRPVDVRQPIAVPLHEDSLRFTLTYEFTTDNATANYVVGVGTSWQPHANSVVRVAGLPRPVVDAWQTVRFAVPAPSRKGAYHVILAMGTEDSVDHLFSATNWAVGAPIWNDGNDLQDLSPSQRTFLRDSGWVVQQRAITGRYRGPEAALALGDSGWRVGVGTLRITGALLVLGTAFDVIVSD
jgi:DNA-binding SARP family transcriptional activator